MIAIINFIAMTSAALILFGLLMRTRGYDSMGWWLFRVLNTYGLVCFAYLAYDTSTIGTVEPTRYLFLRIGCLTLVIAMVLIWYLIRKELRKQTACDFDNRIKEIFNLKDTP